ncbi:MAG: hypothetical protein IT462_04290 [Planctomycetes bacterium]|nr:hypothetical protein [Planctomycetota bacterium]
MRAVSVKAAASGETVAKTPATETAAPPEPEATPQVEPQPAPIDAVGELRRAADVKDATVAARKAIVAVLIARGSSEDLVEADTRLRALAGVKGISAQWLRLQRASIADAGGELADLEGAAREAWLAALRDLPLEARGIHATDGESKDGAFSKRESISYRPDGYVSVAFEARYFGLKEHDDRFDYAFRVAARLLKEDGSAVADFNPPAHTYKGMLDYPAHRFAWFEFVLNQRLPRDLAAGNYTVELTLSDEMGKPISARITLDIRVR